MPVSVQIDDNDLSGFSDPAKDQLKESMLHHAQRVLREVDRLETDRNGLGVAAREVTQLLVSEASQNLQERPKLEAKKRSAWDRVFTALGSLFSLFVGLVFDKEKMADPVVLSLFVFTLVGAIAFTVLSVFRE